MNDLDVYANPDDDEQPIDPLDDETRNRLLTELGPDVLAIANDETDYNEFVTMLQSYQEKEDRA